MLTWVSHWPQRVSVRAGRVELSASNREDAWRPAFSPCTFFPPAGAHLSLWKHSGLMLSLLEHEQLEMSRRGEWWGVAVLKLWGFGTMCAGTLGHFQFFWSPLCRVVVWLKVGGELHPGLSEDWRDCVLLCAWPLGGVGPGASVPPFCSWSSEDFPRTLPCARMVRFALDKREGAEAASFQLVRSVLGLTGAF